MNEQQSKAQPAIVGQVERLLTYLHSNPVRTSRESGLIASESLQEIARLLLPTAGRYGYLPDERYYPEVFFVDTLCRFSGMTTLADGELGVSQYGYLYLSREPDRRLVMLASAFVNDYPWAVLFPRGALAARIAKQRADALQFVLNLKAGSQTQIDRFAAELGDHLGIDLDDKNPPYPSLILEWALRHILITPLARLGVMRLFSQDGAAVDDIKSASSIELTEAGKSLLTLREVRYAGAR